MYTTSATWDSLVADPASQFETRVSINGAYYGKDKLISLKISAQMFAGQQPAVGGCISSELELSMLAPTATIPRMARVRPYVRVFKGSTYSEWIPQGVFFIDTRQTTQNDDGLDVLTLHCYDAMLKTEADFPSTSHSWPATLSEVVGDIRAAIGVSVGQETWDYMSSFGYGRAIGLPVGFSMREVLSQIASMCAGNWIMDYDGKLKLIALNGIPKETNYLIDTAGSAITFGGDRILV